MNTSKEIVLYANKPYKKFRWLGFMSAAQIGFVVVNFILMPTPKLIEERANALKNRLKKKEPIDGVEMILDEYEPNPDYDSATVMQRLQRLSYREMFSPRNILDNVIERPVFSTTALGSALLISSGLGKPHSIELPVQDVSCVTGRKAQMNYCVLKFKGHFGYHLVQKHDGQFLEPRLFDQYLGYSRAWAARP